MHKSPLMVVLYLLADSAWITVAMTVIGWTFALRAPLLPFSTVFLLLATGYALGRLAPASQRVIPQATLVRWTSAQIGCGLLAAAIAVQFGPAAGALSRAWPAALLADAVPGQAAMGISLGLVAAMLIWRRGVASAIEGAVDRFSSLFFWGALVILLCALVDAVCGCGMLHTTEVVLFFVAALAGLSLAQLPAEDGNVSGWFRNVVLVVAMTLFAGALLGKVSSAYGDAVSANANLLWRELVGAVISVIVVVVGPLLEWVVELSEWLARLSGDSRARFEMPNLDGIRAFLSDEEAGTSYRAVLEWTLIALFAYALLKAFAWRFRARFERAAKFSFDSREQMDPTTGVGLRDLFASLLPRWLRPMANPGGRWRYPAGVPGITEVFALYFSMLDSAARRGAKLDRALTPTERCAALTDVLGDAPVGEITKRFNKACYAGERSDTGEIEALRRALDADNSAS